VAVRTALGASRGRIARQFLTESLLIGVAGGAAGLAFAWGIQQWLWAARPPNLLRPGVEPSLGGEVLLFGVLLSLAAGLLFGLAPALQVSRSGVGRTVRDAGRQPAPSGSQRLRSALVIAEVALSVVALAAAGLLIRSLQAAQEIDPGFRTERLLRATYSLRGSGYDEARGQLFHEQVRERLRSAPGVVSAAISSRDLLTQGGANTITVPGQPPPPGALGYLVQMGWVSPGYFETVGIPIVHGRGFDNADRPGGRLIGVINETMARRFWPDGDAIGRQFTSVALPAPVEIVGVARDSRYITIGEEPQSFFYLPVAQRATGSAAPVTLFVATAGPPTEAVPVLRATLADIDASVPLINVASVDEILHAQLWAPRMAATLVSAFGVLALLLAAIGLYGVMAYGVTLGRQEIGLRMALGATPRAILSMVIGRGARVATIGAVLGLALGLLTSQSLAALLYGVDPRDPAAFAAAPAGLLLVALVACYLPARRAARVDPSTTLRG
jgi:predicted permease